MGGGKGGIRYLLVTSHPTLTLYPLDLRILSQIQYLYLLIHTYVQACTPPHHHHHSNATLFPQLAVFLEVTVASTPPRIQSGRNCIGVFGTSTKDKTHTMNSQTVLYRHRGLLPAPYGAELQKDARMTPIPSERESRIQPWSDRMDPSLSNIMKRHSEW